MGKIHISPEFFNILKTTNSMMKMKAVLIFKGKTSDNRYTGNYYFNAICDSALIHVILTDNDVSFDDDRFQIASLNDFIKYAETAGYPKCDISVRRERSIRGMEYDNIIFNGRDKEARIGVADDSVYVDNNYMKIFSDRSADKLRFVAKLGFNPSAMSDIAKDIKLMKSCKAVSVAVDEKFNCKFLIKGNGTQQITRKIDSRYFFIENEQFCKEAFNEKTPQRLFPSGAFRFIDTFGEDTEIELRHYKSASNDILTMKAYIQKNGAIIDLTSTEKNPPRSKIEIVIGFSELQYKLVSNVDYVNG